MCSTVYLFFLIIRSPFHHLFHSRAEESNGFKWVYLCGDYIIKVRLKAPPQASLFNRALGHVHAETQRGLRRFEFDELIGELFYMNCGPIFMLRKL